MVSISSDHIFNKTNYLKFSLLLAAVSLLTIATSRTLGTYRSRPPLLFFFFALIPLLTTLPGTLLNRDFYYDGLIFEWASRALIALFFCFCIYALKSERKPKTYTNWILTATLVSSSLIILEALGLQPQLRLGLSPYERWILGSEPLFSGLKNRPDSSFGNPNYFSACAVMALPLLISSYLTTSKEHSAQVKVGYLISLSVVVAALAIAGTRSAIIGAVFSSCILIAGTAVLSPLSRARALVFIGIMVTIVITVSWNADKLIHRFISLTDYSAWSPRVGPWTTAWESIKSAPLFGSGMGASYRLFFEFVPADYRLNFGERSFNHVHNQILEVLQEGGILGLLGYLFFWGTLFLIGLRYLKSKANTQNKITLLGALCSLLSYHFHSLFSVAERMISVNIYAYAISALVCYLALFSSPGADKQPILKDYSNRFHFFFNVNAQRFFVLVVIAIPIFWSTPFLKEQNAIVKVKAGLIRADEYITTVQSSNNVYALYEGVLQAHKIKNTKSALSLSERLDQTLPHYRDNDYFLAFGNFLSGRPVAAKAAADIAYAYDRYNIHNLHLLARLALDSKELEAFLSALQDIVTMRMCKLKLNPCNSSATHAQTNPINQLIGFKNTGQQTRITLSPLFFSELTKLSKSQEISTLKDKALQWAGQIAQQKYFYPVSSQTTLSRNDQEAAYSELQRYSSLRDSKRRLQKSRLAHESTAAHSLLTQINTYQAAQSVKDHDLKTFNKDISEIKNRLKKTYGIDPALYIRKRLFLNQLASDLLTIVSLRSSY